MKVCSAEGTLSVVPYLLACSPAVVEIIQLSNSGAHKTIQLYRATKEWLSRRIKQKQQDSLGTEGAKLRKRYFIFKLFNGKIAPISEEFYAKTSFTILNNMQLLALVHFSCVNI